MQTSYDGAKAGLYVCQEVNRRSQSNLLMGVILERDCKLKMELELLDAHLPRDLSPDTMARIEQEIKDVEKSFRSKEYYPYLCNGQGRWMKNQKALHLTEY